MRRCLGWFQGQGETHLGDAGPTGGAQGAGLRDGQGAVQRKPEGSNGISWGSLECKMGQDGQPEAAPTGALDPRCGEFLLAFPPNPQGNDVRGKFIPIFAPACPRLDEQSCLSGTEGFSGFFNIFPSFSRVLWLLGCNSTLAAGRG